MFNPRSKPTIFRELKSLSKDRHIELKSKGALDHNFWSTKLTEKVDIALFKSEIKPHYYRGQNRRCCYCSKELDSHQGAYDAEHIIDKKDFPQFMFDFDNLAIACKTCNVRKSSKSVLLNKPDEKLEAVPEASGDYSIVHPLIDDWAEFLEFDEIHRIQAKNKSAKGLKTIEMCGIKYLNAARLADYFSPDHAAKAEDALKNFFRLKSIQKRRDQIALLKEMVEGFDSALAKSIVEILEQEINFISDD